MYKNYLSIALLAVLSAPLTFANTAAGTLPNGKPFQLLGERIDQNAELIEQNRIAIEGLREEVDTINIDLGELESRVLANESSISEALGAIEALSGSVTAIRDDLLSLTTRINNAITYLENELGTLKSSVNTLIPQLKNLQHDLETATAQLNAAIAANASDIAALYATVGTLNSSLSVANSNIITLSWRIDRVEDTLDDQRLSLQSLQSQIDFLDARVTRLEACAACEDDNHGLREFTVNGTAADDYGTDELRTKLADLHYQRGEFFYARTSNAQGEYELCSNNTEIFDAVKGFTEATSYSRWASPTTTTWYRVADTGTWKRPSTVMVSSYTSYFYDSFTFTFYGTMNVSTGLLENKHRRSGFANHDVNANDWDVYGDNTLTIRAGTTAQEACGIQ